MVNLHIPRCDSDFGYSNNIKVMRNQDKESEKAMRQMCIAFYCSIAAAVFSVASIILRILRLHGILGG